MTVSGDANPMHGLTLLVGPPAAGKSTFARSWVEGGRIDAGGVVSCDAVRAELFGTRVDVADDPDVFAEMDRRVSARLAAGQAVVVDATNVLPHARARMLAWARQHDRPAAALRFQVDVDVLLRRNAARTGPARLPEETVREYAALAARHATRRQLLAEGIDPVLDVHGDRHDGSAPRKPPD
ncbi:AAA family ATPase [Dactylosporangium cerinum]|uniref:AAA family ATPase n=1 Tax=Dactylosporangium cerinum TaxID=1434730 RepID=A0ABV9WAW5_9ACTN